VSRTLETETDIRPFHVEIPDADLADLHRRIEQTRWPSAELVGDRSQGVPLATIQQLARDWQQHDWRQVEARLNALPQFVTEIDGVDIHFLHIRSVHPDALPLLVTHGWPGSVLEQLKIIEPLANPTAHGAAADDAFHLVIPSLPGHGFSGTPTETGWDPIRIARAWAELMDRLGYDRYVAQGGDWGNAVTEQLALLQPDALVGIHTNMPATVPDDVAHALQFGEPAPHAFSADEQRAWDQLSDFYRNGLGYATEMANRPQTLYALEDSPVGLAAWMLDHDAANLELIVRVFNGESTGLSKTDILDNITLYWLTRTAVSSARLYWESKLPFFAPKGVTVPTAVSVFPDEIYSAPRSWTEQAYPNLIHYNQLPVGGHFAAWEQPAAYCDEVRSAFRSLRAPAD